MKSKYYIITILLLPIFSYSQIDSSFYKDGKVTYWAVNQVDSSLKTVDILKNFNLWWADYIKNFNSSINHEQWKLKETIPEKTETSIVVKGMFKIDQALISSVWTFDLTVECKNGRYRYTLNNIGNTSNYSGLLSSQPIVTDFIPIEQLEKDGKRRSTINKVVTKITDIIFSMEKALNKKRPDDNF